MKKTFHKILLGLGCIAILGSINKVTTVVEKEALTQTQPSVLCITPYHDGYPFDI